MKKSILILLIGISCLLCYSQNKKEELFTSSMKPFFIAPLDKYRVSSNIGYRIVGMEADIHTGIDLVAPKGSKIKAIADGMVVVNYPPPNGYYKGHPIYGGLIIINHGNGIFSLYAHMSQTWRGGGQIVKLGDSIGIIGATGKAYGVHLHFELIINPMYFIEKSQEYYYRELEKERTELEKQKEKSMWNYFLPLDSPLFRKSSTPSILLTK
jgi:murein DD-endopeptidase MepM/ murein hydrolase activator NlpD